MNLKSKQSLDILLILPMLLAYLSIFIGCILTKYGKEGAIEITMSAEDEDGTFQSEFNDFDSKYGISFRIPAFVIWFYLIKNVAISILF